MVESNKKGFTLIEILVVIGIIGILAAIAIPNMLNYRDKSFCSIAETDAQNIAKAIGDYYATPTHTNMITPADLTVQTTGTNNYTLAGPVTAIIVTVNDVSGRCPATYQAAMGAGVSPTGFWDGTNSYIKTIQ